MVDTWRKIVEVTCAATLIATGVTGIGAGIQDRRRQS